MDKKSTTWVEISRSAIKNNIEQFKKILGNHSQMMAVVKSNAYGHGLVEVAKIAKSASVPWLGTVNLDEALTLRENKIKGNILVLSYFNISRLQEAITKNISLTVYSYSAAYKLNYIANKINKKAKIHIKVDTGTSRLGLMPEQAYELVKKIHSLSNLFIEGIFSHFADAENPKQTFTKLQIQRFDNLLKKLKGNNINIRYPHIACSAATLLNKNSLYRIARVGISLYGLWSVEKDGGIVKKLHLQFKLTPALSWYTRIIQIKEIPSKINIGYGRTYKTTNKIKLAILPVGYWDGYDRKLSNKGTVIINGIICPIRGRVCMNLCMVDVSLVKNIRVGDRVTLIGQEGKKNISVDNLAAKLNTINYEIITRINPLIQRYYIK